MRELSHLTLVEWLSRVLTSVFIGVVALSIVAAVISNALDGSEPDELRNARPRYRVTNVVVHDVDTVKGIILLPFKSAAHGTIRFDFDGWEVTRARRTVKVADDELERGRKARDELKALLTTHELYVDELPKKLDIDPYDRFDVVAFAVKGGKSIRLKNWAAERGHIRPAVTAEAN